MVAEYTELEGMQIPVVMLKAPISVDCKVELELEFDPPLLAKSDAENT